MPVCVILMVDKDSYDIVFPLKIILPILHSRGAQFLGARLPRLLNFYRDSYYFWALGIGVASSHSFGARNVEMPSRVL